MKMYQFEIYQRNGGSLRMTDTPERAARFIAALRPLTAWIRLSREWHEIPLGEPRPALRLAV